MWALGLPNPSPQGPHNPSPSSPVMQMLRTESRVPSGRSPPPSGQARTASCTRGQPCTVPRRSDLGRRVGGCFWGWWLPWRGCFHGNGEGARLPPGCALFPLPCSPCSRFDLAVCGAHQEAAEVPVPVHAGPACLWRGEGRAREAPGAEGRGVALRTLPTQCYTRFTVRGATSPPCVWGFRAPRNPLWLGPDLGARLSEQRRSGWDKVPSCDLPEFSACWGP